MKTQFHKICRALFLTKSMALVAVFSPAAANAISLSLEPSGQDVAPGDSFSVSLGITGLGDFAAPSVGGFDLNVVFDPVLMQFDSVTFGDPGLGNLLAPNTSSVDIQTLNTGSVNLFSVSLDSAEELEAVQPGAFILATLQFSALASGTGTLGLSDVIISDSLGAALPLEQATGAIVNIASDQAVPEGSLGLSGIVALGAIAFAHRQLRSVRA